ncbi:hypothetical protein KJ966_25055 [bacterium]|nr:hypothetical protein [bacterium]
MLDKRIFSQLEINHPMLAAVFKEHWQTPLDQYTALLYDKDRVSIEPELRDAFCSEWECYGKNKKETEQLLDELESTPVLQTSHHVTPTNGPTFLAYDLISLAGLRENKTYMVAANSGVAFSNPAWSGALSYGQLSLDWLLLKNTNAYRQAEKSARDRSKDGQADNRISLIPAKMRDQLVFGTRISDFQVSLFNQFAAGLKEISIPMVTDQVYSIWASGFCSRVQSAIFQGKHILYFDVNRVISRYIVHILQSRTKHPLLEILFSDRINKKINEKFENPVFFQGNWEGKKSFKVDGLRWQFSRLIGEKSGIRELGRQQLIEELQQETLCPGIFLQFFILRFLNGICCLGSFNQIEYMESYRRGWSDLKTGWQLFTDPDYRETLTTGRLINKGKAVWPLDLALKGDTINLQQYLKMEMSYFWEPIVKQILL